MRPTDLEIIPVTTRQDLKSFIKFPYSLYRNDPHWIPSLYWERRETIHPKKNPFYQHAAVQLFLAKRAGRPVGRLSAHIDHEYLKRYGNQVGSFGFFDSENDPKIAQALFHSAEEFFQSHKVSLVRGPFNFSINEECGLLIQGFDQPLMTMMPYNPPYYADLLEGVGYRKAKDLFAWKYEIGKIPEDPEDIANVLSKQPGLIVRKLEKKNLDRDLDTIMEIFNSAWSDNWSFVPLTPAEAKKAAKDLKLFMDPEIAFIAEVDGQPAAMCVSVPNFYEIIRGTGGRMFPFGFLKILWRIKRKKYRSGRLMLFGLKKEYRTGNWSGLSILLYVKIHRYAQQRGYKFAELSWTLEDNIAVNAGIEFMGGKHYKTMRIYEKKLS